MSSARLALVLALALTSCSETAVTTLGPPQTLPPPPTSTSTTTPGTDSSTTTTSTEAGVTTTVAPLLAGVTVGELNTDQLVLMLPEAVSLGDLYLGLAVSSRAEEDNDRVIATALQGRVDQIDDVDAFQRITGARLVLRPRLVEFVTGGVEGVDMTVALFADAEGAEGWLEDFVRDVGKGLDTAVPTDLLVDNSRTFPVEELGDEAVGIIFEERVSLSDEPTRQQTTVLFRVDRLLASATVVGPPDTDQRLRALRAATDLAGRVERVLSGELQVPPPPPAPQQLDIYAFTYSQTIDRGTVVGKTTASGVEDLVRDAVACDIALDLEGDVSERSYVVIGDTAWTSVGGSPFTEVPRDSVSVASDLLFCPGWSGDLDLSGLGLALAGSPVTEVELEDGTAGLRYDLGLQGAQRLGLLPAETRIEVPEFTVITDAVSPWLRSVRLEMTGPTREFAELYGEDFVGLAAPTSSVVVEFESTQINDPALGVDAPE